MILSNPTLLFSADAELEAQLHEQIQDSPTYLVRAPHREAFDRLVAQLVFGIVAVDFPMLAGTEGGLDPELLSLLIDEAVESNSQVRIMVYNAPDEATLERLLESGVHDVLLAPVVLRELILRLERAADAYAWLAQRKYYVGKSGHIFRVEDIVGDSPPMKEIFEQVRKIAPSRTPVLITGETGSGKELIAAAIHYNSPRREGPFIKVNCAALQDTLLESDLFGHEKGSFTGAHRQRIGRFEQAHGGTLFLDEVGEMSAAVQAKVLRVLQNQEFERVGGTRVIRVDVRIIAATNRVLEQAIAEGTFREDLFYRLNVVTMHIPPLRERQSDIPRLARFFLKKARYEERSRVEDFTPEALDYLCGYAWPGNVRELENTVYQAVLLAGGQFIEIEDLAVYRRPRPAPGEAGTATPPDAGRVPPESAGSIPTEELELEDMERLAILRALKRTGWIQSRAADLLGVSRRALNYKIAKFGITHPRWRVHRFPDGEPGEETDRE
jgi:Nif-specific regulatory protein